METGLRWSCLTYHFSNKDSHTGNWSIPSQKVDTTITWEVLKLVVGHVFVENRMRKIEKLGLRECLIIWKK